jgi:hypothetical protein
MLIPIILTVLAVALAVLIICSLTGEEVPEPEEEVPQ